MVGEGLSLTPKQALSTLSDNAKYYAHMVVKGIKGSFEEILNLLALMKEKLSRLMYLAEANPENNYQFFLDVLKPTFISREPEVAIAGSILFEAFAEESLKYNSKNLVYQLLVQESAGFDFLYMALKRHPDLSTNFAAGLYPVIRESLNDFFEVHLKRTINNPQEYLKVLLSLLQGIIAHPPFKTTFE